MLSACCKHHYRLQHILRAVTVTDFSGSLFADSGVAETRCIAHVAPVSAPCSRQQSTTIHSASVTARSPALLFFNQYTYHQAVTLTVFHALSLIGLKYNERCVLLIILSDENRLRNIHNIFSSSDLSFYPSSALLQSLHRSRCADCNALSTHKNTASVVLLTPVTFLNRAKGIRNSLFLVSN